MKYIPKELKENVNISKSNLLIDFFILLGSIVGIGIILYIILGFAVEIIVPHLPEKVENSLEELFTKKFKKQKTTKAEVELQRILDELLENSPSQYKYYKVHIIPHPKANAFAYPGGNILVFSSLLNQAAYENEIAFVLAHELGHYANRDHLRGFGRKLVFFTMSIIFLGQDSSITHLIRKSLQKVDRKFSQHQEMQADRYALDLLYKRYGHVGGCTGFLERSKRKTKDYPLLYYFATHPHPQDRIKILDTQVRQKGYPLKEQIAKKEILMIKFSKSKKKK